MSGKPGVPDVNGTPSSRPEANSLGIKHLRGDLEDLRDGVTTSFHNVEDEIEELHRKIGRIESRLEYAELYIGEHAVHSGDRDE